MEKMLVKKKIPIHNNSLSTSFPRSCHYLFFGRDHLRSGSSSVRGHLGCFPLCQRFWKFRLELKWKGPFRFLPTGIFGITSGGGPLISVGIFRSKFAVPFLRNRFFALIREFGNDQEWQELFLLVGAV